MSDTESACGNAPTPSKDSFKEIVKEWCEIIDRLNEIKQTTSALNKRKKKLSESIIAFMEINNAEYCNLGNNGSIEMKKQKSTAALKKDDIVSLLKQLGQSETECEKTASFLIEGRRTQMKSVLKRKV